MRECRELLDKASAKGEVPRWQFAYIEDRVRVYEGFPQHYGTQWRDGPEGLEPYPIENPSEVDERRSSVGLPPLAEVRASARVKRPWDPETARQYEEQELAWRRSVGWVK